MDQEKVVCEAYIIAWNRADTIHMTIKHYQQFCQRIVIFDNYSDDKTREIALQLGADVRLFGTKGVLDDQAYIDVKNNCWKTSRADWVIVCDDDEILWHSELSTHLQAAKNQNRSVIPTQGYSMYAELLPRGTWLEVNTGVEDNNYSKTVIFDPKKISKINYVYGCHEAKPQPYNIPTELYCGGNLMLLHYRSIGGVERLIDRHHEYEPRRRKSAVNMKWNLGHHYAEPDDLKRKQWAELAAKSRTLF